MAATAKPEASVSVRIGFSGSKCCNTGTVVKAAFSFRNASFASFVKMYGPVFLLFLLPVMKLQLSEVLKCQRVTTEAPLHCHQTATGVPPGRRITRGIRYAR